MPLLLFSLPFFLPLTILIACMCMVVRSGQHIRKRSGSLKQHLLWLGATTIALVVFFLVIRLHYVQSYGRGHPSLMVVALHVLFIAGFLFFAGKAIHKNGYQFPHVHRKYAYPAVILFAALCAIGTVLYFQAFVPS